MFETVVGVDGRQGGRDALRLGQPWPMPAATEAPRDVLVVA